MKFKHLRPKTVTQNPKPLSSAYGAASAAAETACAGCVLRGRRRGRLGPPHRRGGNPPPPLRLPPSRARLGRRPLPRRCTGSSRWRQPRHRPLLPLGQGKRPRRKAPNGTLELRSLTPGVFIGFDCSHRWPSRASPLSRYARFLRTRRGATSLAVAATATYSFGR